jgi:hypothetical protein
LRGASRATVPRVNALAQRTPPSRKLQQSLGLVLTCIILAFVGLLSSGCQRGPATVVAELNEANRLAADVRVQFNKAADASNRAVMAETDEASIAFARDAEQLSTAVEHDVGTLHPLLNGLASNEVQMLERFGKQFSDYRKVDSDILALAVENTNLKAQRLSFGPAKDAADRFKAALGTLPTTLTATDRCRGDALVFRAVLAVRELQTLQGPHIASADDVAMAAMEKQMATLDASVSEALAALTGVVDPAQLTAARAAFDDFKSLGEQIVKLSRRNSNVRSLDLSLRVKPPLTAACDDSLRALQQALTNEGSKATR